MAHISSVALGPFRRTERKNRRGKWNGCNNGQTVIARGRALSPESCAPIKRELSGCLKNLCPQ